MKRWCALLLAASLASLHAQDARRGISLVGNAGKVTDIPGNVGKRYALCIGVSAYEDPDIRDLDKARNDAEALGKALKSAGQFDVVSTMTDGVDPRFDELRQYPRLSNIRAQLEQLGAFIRPEDLVVFSFSGHGIADEAGEGYLVVADTNMQDTFASSLPIKEIVEWIQKLGVRKSLLLIDACRETVSQRASRGLAKNNLRSETYERAELSAVFYATRTGWYSFEDTESDYGIFTRFLLEGVRGKADYQYGNRDGIVTFRELSGYVEDAVATYALERGLKQRPYTRILGETFGDLAVSTYSANIDMETRVAVVDDGGRAATGLGTVEVYSNVDSQLALDGRRLDPIRGGETRVLDRVPSGPHLVELSHAYGVLRKEVTVSAASVVSVPSIVVQSEKDPVSIEGVVFVYVAAQGGMPGFWMAESEITMGQFADFVEESGYRSQGRWMEQYRPAYERYPVFLVTRDDCVAYATWFGRKTGRDATLPTLAQWQYAAGGRYSTGYPWGDEWNATYCHNGSRQPAGMLPIIGSDGPVQEQFFFRDITLDGITNLAGNVREWCSDEKSTSEGGILGATIGGSWRLKKPRQFARDSVTYRPAHLEEEDLGFRIVLAD